jgi:hypothetical protein
MFGAGASDQLRLGRDLARHRRGAVFCDDRAAEVVEGVSPCPTPSINQSDRGYYVRLNGLDRDIAYMDETQKRFCQVLGIHPVVSEPLKSVEFRTVYVDSSCPGNPPNTTPSTP